MPRKWVVAYLAGGLTFGVLDALWLRWAGPNLYRPALAFYLAYLAAMMWFAVRPGLAKGVPQAVLNGALLVLQAINWLAPVEHDVTAGTSVLALSAFTLATLMAWWVGKSEGEARRRR